MSATLETRDAYLWVEIDHPDGDPIRGRMVPWRDAIRIMAVIDEWKAGAPISLLETARIDFLALTGIPEGAIVDLSPGATVNFMYRFFGALPIAPTKPTEPAAATGTAAPLSPGAPPPSA